MIAGGYCECPGGEIVAAASISETRTELQCTGGTPLSFFAELGPWSFRRVECGAAYDATDVDGILVEAVHQAGGNVTYVPKLRRAEDGAMMS